MKRFILPLSLVLVAMSFTVIKKAPSFTPVVLVELFTSQGCSSCPSAERLLNKTLEESKKTGKPVLALSFHVDYWNRLGWNDPFSDKQFSDRQKMYANQFGLNSVYTPQAVVNGQQEFVGSDEQKLRSSIKTSLTENAIAGFKTINAEILKDHSAKVTYTLEGDYSGCNINVALVSLSENTAVKRGENSGAMLTGKNIVRQFISKAATAQGEASFNVSPSPMESNRGLVAFIQNRRDGKIAGAVMLNNF
ncbi:MAG: DUF1223 domain-containing protein [Ferruginibacter sp.]